MYECRNDMDIFAGPWRRASASTTIFEKTEMEWLRELTQESVADFDTFAEKGRGRVSQPPRTRSRFRGRRSAIRRTSKFTTPSGKIEIYSMALAANPDPYGPGPYPAHSDLDRAGEARGEIFPLMLCSPKVLGGAHPFDPRQPAAAGAGRPRRRLDEHRRTPLNAGHLETGRRGCASSTTAARPCCRLKVTRPRIAPGRRLDQGRAAWINAGQ